MRIRMHFRLEPTRKKVGRLQSEVYGEQLNKTVMKGRQLSLSLSLLLLGGLCLNTGIQAQSGGGGQISVQIVGGLSPGGTNTLSVSPYNGTTLADLQSFGVGADAIFDVVNIDPETGQATFILAAHANQLNQDDLMARLGQQLNQLQSTRTTMDSDFRFGSVADPDDPFAQPGSNLNRDGTLKNVE